MRNIANLVKKIGIGRIALTLLIIPSFCLEHAFRTNHQLVERVFSRGISKGITQVLSHILIIPAEALMIGAAIALLFGIVFFIRGVTKSREKLLYTTKKVFLFLSLCAVGQLFFIVSWGMNYYRVPIAQNLSLLEVEVTKDNLKSSFIKVQDELNFIAPTVTRNENGIFDVRGKRDLIFKRAKEGYEVLSEDYDIFDKKLTKVDGVSFFGLMNYTRITGFYFPFNARPNVNISFHPLFLPFDACHELGHQVGIAKEDETNFAGFLAGINNSDRDFQYSALMFAYFRLGNDYYAADPKGYMEEARKLDENAQRDIQDYSEFLKQYETVVGEVSEDINDRYLKGRGETEGVISYEKVTKLLVSYYESLVKTN